MTMTEYNDIVVQDGRIFFGVKKVDGPAEGSPGGCISSSESRPSPRSRRRRGLVRQRRGGPATPSSDASRTCTAYRPAVVRRRLQVELAVPRAEHERPPLRLRVPQHRLRVEGGPHGHGAVGQVGDLDPLLVLLGTGRAVPLDAGDVEGVELVLLPLLARLDLLCPSPPCRSDPFPTYPSRDSTICALTLVAASAPPGAFARPGRGAPVAAWYSGDGRLCTRPRSLRSSGGRAQRIPASRVTEAPLRRRPGALGGHRDITRSTRVARRRYEEADHDRVRPRRRATPAPPRSRSPCSRAGSRT